MCIISQISSLPSHKVAVNTGFQVNYGLPFTLSNFYSPIFWARSFSNVSSPVLNFFEKFIESQDNNADEDERSEEDDDNDTTTIASEEEMTTDIITTEALTATTEALATTKKSKRKHKPKVKRDLSAGEFYSGIKELMNL